MKFSLFCLVFVFSSGTFAQKKLSIEEAREDLKFLYTQMQKVHPGLYAYQDSTIYAHLYDSLLNAYKSEIEYFDFFKSLAPMLNAISDLHTNYSHAKWWSKSHDKNLPFISKKVNDKLLVQYNASTDSSFYRGLVIEKIDDKPISEILSAIENSIGTDNGNPLAKQLYATRKLYAYYPKFYILGDSVKIEAKDPKTDSTLTFHLASIPRKKVIPAILKRYPEKARKNLSYKLIDSTKHLAKLDISSFVYKGVPSPLNIFQNKFKQKLKKQFKAIEKDSVDHLIIDLRGNGGGYIPNVSHLLKYLSKEPYKLIDTMAFKKEAYWKIFPVYTLFPPLIAPFYFNKKSDTFRYHANGKAPKKKPVKKHNFKGNLYVLMDANSYSATVFTICILKDMNRSIFVGTIPAGATWGSHAGGWYTPKLPNSKIKLHIPEYRIVHAQRHRSDEHFFIKPDWEVKETPEDFENDKDAFIEAVNQLIINTSHLDKP